MPELSKIIPPEDQKIIEELKKSGTTASTIGFVQGAFGDMEDCEALLEKIVTPPEGGTFMKFYGCSYLFKGFPVTDFVENLSLAKALLSFVPREIIAKSFLFKTSLIFLFLFARKRFLYYANLYFGMIFDRTIVKANMNEIRYNIFAKELRRATDKALRMEFEPRKPFNQYVALEIIEHKKLRLLVLIAKVLEFSYFIFEHDNAYRFRAQDILENLDRKNVVNNGVISEVKRLLQILIDREDEVWGLKSKWITVRKMAILFLYFSPTARRIAKNILLEFDVDKVKLDEADWYFCLRRKTYKFRNISLEDRLEEKAKIDKEKGHINVKFIYKSQLTNPTETTTVHLKDEK